MSYTVSSPSTFTYEMEYCNINFGFRLYLFVICPDDMCCEKNQ